MVEGQNITADAVLQEAAVEAGLDVPRFRPDNADQAARRAEYEAQTRGFPHLPIGFYKLAVIHGRRTVLLDHAFEPSVVEDAIEWLSDGRLRKDQPTDIVGYLRAHGPAPLVELRWVFGLPEPTLGERLSALRREGKVDSVVLSGGDGNPDIAFQGPSTGTGRGPSANHDRALTIHEASEVFQGHIGHVTAIAAGLIPRDASIANSPSRMMEASCGGSHASL